MEHKVIVFKNETGGIAIIDPISNYPHLNPNGYTLEQIAAKDVPSGLTYAIMDKSELPSDRTFRNAWEIPDELLVDGVGSPHNTFEV